MKKRNKILTIISSIFGVFAICGFSLFSSLDQKKNSQSVYADDYDVSFSNSSSLSYLNYNDGGVGGGYVLNGYTTNFTCSVFTSISEVVSNGYTYYVPAITLNFTNFQVFGDSESYVFDIYADSSYSNSIITFNNMVRENLNTYVDYSPTNIYCDIQIYGFDYTTRPVSANKSFKICLEVELSTIYDSLNVFSIRYNQELTCYTNFSLQTGVSMGDYLGKANTSISNNGYTWHELYRQIGLPIDNSLAYEQGYQYGYTSGYEKGSLDGYNQGYSDGVASQQPLITSAYNTGYDEGYQNGVDSQVPLIQEAYSNGYTEGYNDGYSTDSTVGTIFSRIFLVAMLPVDFFLRILNWEILGINIASFVSALLSVAATVIVIRLVTGKKE